MKVLWITNIPSPYRVSFFNELGKKCNLTVAFEMRHAKDRDESWKHQEIKTFNAVFFHGIAVGPDKAISFDVFGNIINKSYDVVVVTNYASLTGLFAIAKMKCKSINYMLEGDGGFPGEGSPLKESIKRWVISDAVCCFSTSQMHDSYYRKYGAKNIVRYPFSSIHEYDIDKERITKEEKRQIRNKLNISEDFIILSVGQFIPRKGYDMLIKAADNIPNTVGIYIIGGNRTEEYEKLVKNKTNIHFVEFLRKQELKEYYRSADLFVHPTREDIWGLVINEAMAHALPVLTTNKCIAGLELVNDENGMIIEANDQEALEKGIVRLMNTDVEKLGLESLKRIKRYTIEEMAERHIEIWTTLQNKELKA